MTDHEYFNRFQQLCINILAQSGNCSDSQQLFRSARSVPELVSAWKRFWDGLIHEVPELVVNAFQENYDTYRSDINRAGVFYNEAPEDSSAQAIVLVGDAEKEGMPALCIDGRHRVYVLGNRRVWTNGSCNVSVNAEKAVVNLYDSCRANIEEGTVIAKDRSVVSGKGYVICYDAATIKIFSGMVEDYGHLSIDAYNDAVVRTCINRRIYIHDKAKIILI